MTQRRSDEADLTTNSLLGLEERPSSPLLEAMRRDYRTDERALLEDRLIPEARIDPAAKRKIHETAARLVETVRANRRNEGGVDRFMHEYQLSSAEGVALMCVAEALLRIPDDQTADLLIEDQIGGADWRRHLGKADSLFVNASTLALMISGRVLKPQEQQGLSGVFGRLTHRLGEPVIRAAVRQAMKIMGRQFVMGRTIEEALARAKEDRVKGWRHSFDMLGESAYTMEDAERYFQAYVKAVKAVGAASKGQGPVAASGVSVKLSALHPRYEFGQIDRVRRELYPKLRALAELAAQSDVGLCVDAEEADRLDPALELFERLAREPALKSWQGLGLAVQAYQRRARSQIDWLAHLGASSGRRLMARLVKGAYWDAEIKRAQENGLTDYPVFTRKPHTDVSYIACARAMLAAPKAFYPCFATHNAQTVATILTLAEGRRDFEFQRLHGMGEPLYHSLVEGAERPVACRIYAPVGPHQDLLAYLVRRLLENGANSSFVNRIVDDAQPVEAIIRDPVEETLAGGARPNPRIPAPAQIFAPRRNSAGMDLSDPIRRAALDHALAPLEAEPPRSAGDPAWGGPIREILSPADAGLRIGTAHEATPQAAAAALERLHGARKAWETTPAARRAELLRRAADLYEAKAAALMRLCVREAGKTWRDAVAEIREAVDFLRYYAAEAERLFGAPVPLPGPTGEENTLFYAPRGVWLCVSPWNFPLAIFTGQIAAALAAGNLVLAKPAEQTPLIAQMAVDLLHEAGIPRDALALLPGDGAVLGGALIPDPRVAGVAFTGSTEVARIIARQLIERPGPIAPLIAETGGINAMILDSSALPEQVARDALASAFQSAGQRCSALRVIYIPEDAAERQIALIAGAMQELRMGDPLRLSTDVGPVIDADAAEKLRAHAAKLRAEGALLGETTPPEGLPPGHWIAPQMFRIPQISALEREVFGPILHVRVYKTEEFESLPEEIAATGYGLTIGIHSRIKSRWRDLATRLPVGNIYVNRNQIGAVVGAQPFGGEGLSGTGPKAGGPNYLLRFVTERVLSADLTAQGGDAQLMSLGD